MSVELLKFLFALIIFVVNLASALTALWAINKARAKARFVEVLANSVTAGLFLGIVNLLLYPELPIAEEEVRQVHNLTHRFSITSFFTVVGIIAMILLDAVLNKWKAQDTKLELATEMTDLSLPSTAVSTAPFLPTHEAEENNLFKFILFTTLMSLHSFFEGLPLGYKKTSADVTAFSVPMIIHKALEAITVATAGQKEKKQHVVICCLLHSIMTPAGTLVGCLVNGEGGNLEKDLVLLVIMGMSVGTMVYITFIEVLAPLLNEYQDTSDLVKIAGVSMGFAITALITVLIGELEKSSQ